MDRNSGNGAELRYGQLCDLIYSKSVNRVEIAYKAYTRRATGEPLEEVDESKSYMIKHGNGRTCSAASCGSRVHRAR